MNYDQMSIDNLTDYRNQWPAQQSEWNRAELALQKRLAVKHAFLDLAEELRDEGLELIPSELMTDSAKKWVVGWSTFDIDDVILHPGAPSRWRLIGKKSNPSEAAQ